LGARLLGRIGGLSFAALLVLGAAQGAQADTFVGGTNVWTMVGPPSLVTTPSNPMGVVAFSNSIGVTVSGIVIMVLRNNASQTVYYSTATLTLESGKIGSAALVEFGLVPGTYNATFFAITFGGVAISSSTSALITLPGPR
jgi:hypothetical protein